MKSVVITGSTRGIGFGLADAFLSRGCQVMVSGRTPEAVDEAVERLAMKNGAERVFGQACDVSEYQQVQALWEMAVERFTDVDIWINNAGSGHLLSPVWELDVDTMRQVIETNLLGTLYGCKVALQGMLAQGHGSLYNMEGYGSRGKPITPGLSVYGASKAAMRFLDASLAKELEGKPVLFGSILPGMVVTDLLLNQRSGDPKDWERSKAAFNMLADRVETVAPWIAERILENEKSGTRITWLSGWKLFTRLASAPFRKRHVID